MNDSEIDKIVLRVRSGDTGAFEPIVRHFERPVRGWLIARCPPLADADEIAQETFLIALKRIDEYTPGTNFTAWLFTIARYQLMAETTRLARAADYHSRYAPYALIQELERRASGEIQPIDDRIEYLRTCLDALEGPARKAIDLRYAAGLSLDEIADRIGRTSGATRKYLCVLRKKLRQCVEHKLAVQEG